jgi:peptidoglycan lytic transglycosylase
MFSLFEPAIASLRTQKKPMKFIENGATIIGLAVASILSICFANTTTAAQQRQVESGIAAIHSGKTGKTTSGEAFNSEKMTAAHRSLPFGTMVRVTNTQNARSVVVRINDRGPFSRGRIIDVTPAAARALGFSGVVPVKISPAGPDG